MTSPHDDDGSLLSTSVVEGNDPKAPTPVVVEERFNVISKSFTFGNGDRYEGDFDLINAAYHGNGKFKWASGMVYDGAWWKGRRSGFGRLSCTDGSVYEGDFVNNNKHGRGILTRADGGKYEGPWVDDKMSGDGGVFT